MSLFTRQLAKRGKPVVLEDRNHRTINGATSEVFTELPKSAARPDQEDPFNDVALVCTLRGVKVFDSTNTETVATHEFRLNWRDDVGAEQWVTLKGKRLRILTAENCCEDDKVLILMCTERGEDAQVVNRA